MPVRLVSDNFGRSVRRKLALLILVLHIGAGFATGCAPCNRSGCQALSSPAVDTGRSGIGGVVAIESDVITNGCQECTFGSTTLAVWKTSSPVTDRASARAAVDNSPPTMTILAENRYDLALDPGQYLVCRRPNCVLVEVVSDHLTPVNVRIIFGPTNFIVFDRTSRRQALATEFDVGL